MRVGLCFRHFSSWSQQLPHGGMQQECQRQLPGIRESLCGNRRGWRREQVKEVWQWIARFARCPAHITEQVNSRAWVKSLKHSKVHREEVKKTTTVFASRPVSIWVLCLSGLSATVQIINWNIDVATDLHTYPSTAEMCVCSINRLLWAYRYLKAGTVRQRWASRCNSIHSCTARDSQGSILIWGMPFEDEDLLWCYLMMFWWVFLPTSHNTVNSYFHLSDIQLWFRIVDAKHCITTQKTYHIKKTNIFILVGPVVGPPMWKCTNMVEYMSEQELALRQKLTDWETDSYPGPSVKAFHR